MAAKVRNVKLTIAYDGTNYHGFQEQCGTGLQTIQETLEKCLAKIAGKKIRVYGAGRTDAGVHARGQVVNFDCSGWPVPVDRIPLALNSVLPEDIVVVSAEEVPEDFHARFSALAKLYRYSILNSRQRSPFLRLYSLFEPRPLDIDAMQKAGKLLVGRHDFKSFQAAGSTVKSTVREMYQCNVESKGSLVEITFSANGFLYNMARIMTGTLIQVGLGKMSFSEIQNLLEAGNRALAGPTVPPQGLCLEEVKYKQD